MSNYLRCLAWAIFAMTSMVMEAALADTLNVTAVIGEEGLGQQEFVAALRAELKGSTIAISQAAISQPPQAADLIVVVGHNAATKVAATATSPVLFVLISRESYVKLQRDNPQRAGLFSAIYLDQPIERQVALLKRAFPHVRHVGVMYGHALPELKTLRSKIAEHGYMLHEQEVTIGNGLPMALQALLQDSEVILALPDGDIYNSATIRNILLATYRARVPIMGFSGSFVRAGAACAVYSTPNQIAKQTAAAIRQFSNTRALPAAQYSREFEVQINQQVAYSLGLSIPPREELEKEIGE